MILLPPPHTQNTYNFTCTTTTTVSNICLGNEGINRRKNTANEVNVNNWKVAPVEEADDTIKLDVI